MLRAVQDITIEKNVYPENKIQIKLDGNLITNEIYHLAKLFDCIKMSKETLTQLITNLITLQVFC